MIDFISVCKPFIFGGVAGVTATSIIQPIDVIKTTMQLRPGITVGEAIQRTYKVGNIGGFYKGLSAALMRQSIYTTIRIGLFPTFMEKYPPAKTQLFPKMCIGVLSGAIASFVSTPTDLVLTRMQSDNTSFNEVKYRYRNIFHGIYKISQKEGILALWNGAGAIVPRAMAINGVLLPSYHHSKYTLVNNGYNSDSYTVRIVPSLMAGLSSATISQPFDIIKAHKQANPYEKNNNVFKTVGRFISSRGITGLYRGFPIYLIRIVPHGFMTTFIVDTLWRLDRLYY
tara:strand:+ start:106 stop:957 length:852 start_codon:yes stop_codon:yes gene_type:complete